MIFANADDDDDFSIKQRLISMIFVLRFGSPIICCNRFVMHFHAREDETNKRRNKKEKVFCCRCC